MSKKITEIEALNILEKAKIYDKIKSKIKINPFSKENEINLEDES